MAFEVFKPLSTTILGEFTSWLALSGSLVAAVQGPILAALTIKLMWQGFNAIRGVGGRMVLVDAVFNSLRVILVWWVALSAGAYAANVQGFIFDLRTDLTNLFVPTATDAYAAIDTMMTKATEALSSIYLWAGDHISLVMPTDVSGVVAIFSGFVMVGCMAIFGLVSTVNLLFVDLSLYFLVAIGPLFIACFAFQSTARFFDAWLATVLKFVFMAVLVSAISGMAISIMSGYANKLAADVDTIDFLTATFAALGASGVLILFAVFAPALAGSIAGGIGVNALSFSKVAGPIGSAMAVAGSAGQSLAGGAVNAASWTAGRAAGTSAGQAVTHSAPAQAVSSSVSALRSVANVLGGSPSAAFEAGRGGSISAGSSPSSSAPTQARPLGAPSGSRVLPAVSPAQARAADGMRLAA
jgi:type IV secretion system protein VirB6